MDGGSVLFALICIVVAIIAGYFVNNWYNKVTKRIRLLETQVFLLNKIAEKLGVEKNDLYASERIMTGENKLS